MSQTNDPISAIQNLGLNTLNLITGSHQESGGSSSNPFIADKVSGISSYEADRSKWKQYRNSNKVPAGMVPIFSTKTGDAKPPIIGYADPHSNNVVVFDNADAQSKAIIAAVATNRGSSSNGTSFDAGTPPPQTVRANLTQAQTNLLAQQGATPSTNPTTGFLSFASPASLSQSGLQSDTGGPITGFDENPDGTKIADASKVGQQLINFKNPSQSDLQAQMDAAKYGGPAALATAAGGQLFSDHKTADAAINALMDMSIPDLKALQTKLMEANFSGVHVNGVADPATMKAYNDLLVNVYNYQQTGHGDVTPDSLLDRLVSSNAGGKQSTTTATDTTLTNPSQAQGFLLSSMQQLLGRDPTPVEVSKFISSLQAAEKANPKTITTTSSTATDQYGQAKTASQTTSGGVGGSLSPGTDYANQWVNQNFGPEVNAGKVGDLFSILMGAGGGSTSSGG